MLAYVDSPCLCFFVFFSFLAGGANFEGGQLAGFHGRSVYGLQWFPLDPLHAASVAPAVRAQPLEVSLYAEGWWMVRDVGS